MAVPQGTHGSVIVTRGSEMTLSDAREAILASRSGFDPQTLRRIDRNTFRFAVNGSQVFRFWNSDIAELSYDGKHIRLWTRGHRTPTTKDRLNMILRLLDFPQRVFVQNRVWMIGDLKKAVPFAEGVIAHLGGKVELLVGGLGEVAKKKALELRIKKFIEHVRKQLHKDWPVPEDGDCLLCRLPLAKGNGSPSEVTLGGDSDHLLQHMDQNYVHGSLLLRAYRFAGYGSPEYVFESDRRGKRVSSAVRNLRRYLRSRLIDSPLGKV